MSPSDGGGKKKRYTLQTLHFNLLPVYLEVLLTSAKGLQAPLLHPNRHLQAHLGIPSTSSACFRLAIGPVPLLDAATKYKLCQGLRNHASSFHSFRRGIFTTTCEVQQAHAHETLNCAHGSKQSSLSFRFPRISGIAVV